MDLSPFEKLPTETKAFIVQLARHQDDAYRRRVQTDEYDSSPQYTTKALRLAETAWTGRSVNALLGVNRELYAIAAPFVFDRVTTKQLHRDIWKWDLSSRCGHLVKELVLEGSGAAVERVLASAWMVLPNIYRLVLHNDAAQFLVNNSTARTDRAPMVHKAFLRLADRITDLTLWELEPQHQATVIAWFPRVVALHLAVNAHSGTRDRLSPGLMAALRDPSALKTLSISQDIVGGGVLPIAWSAAPALPSKRLAISTLAINSAWEGCQPFVELIAGTLEHLEIVLRPDWPDFAFRPHSFPSLRTLNITSSSNGARDPTRFLLDASSSPLEAITITYSPTDEDDEAPTIPAELFRPFQKTLRRLHVKYNECFSVDRTPGHSLCHAIVALKAGGRGLIVTEETKDPLLFDSESPYLHKERCDALKQLLKFGMAAVESSRKHRDRAQSAHLGRLLLGLKGWELLSKN